MLFYAHAICLFVFLGSCYHALAVLIYPDGFHKDVLPSCNRTFALIQTQRRAWRRIRWGVFWYCVVTGFAHVYCKNQDELVAHREATRMQPFPFGCGMNQDWSSLTMAERVRERWLGERAVEERCAEYLARYDASIWPNPLMVLADTLVLVPCRWIDSVSDAFGSGLSHLLSHFGWVMQGVLVLVIPVSILVWMLLALKHGSGLGQGPAPAPAPVWYLNQGKQLSITEEIE